MGPSVALAGVGDAVAALLVLPLCGAATLASSQRSAQLEGNSPLPYVVLPLWLGNSPLPYVVLPLWLGDSPWPCAATLAPCTYFFRPRCDAIHELHVLNEE